MNQGGDIFFRIAPTHPGLILLTVALAAVATWYFASLRQRRSFRLSLALVVLRSLAFAAVILFLLEPAVLRQRKEKIRPAVAVMLDNSLSMSLPGGNDGSRFSEAVEIISDASFREMEESYHMEYFGFSENILPFEADGIGDLKPEGQRTLIGDSLHEVLEKSSGTLGAVVVLSDGGHVETEAAPPLKRDGSKVPVFFVGLGDTAGTKDIEIASVNSPGMAFAGQEARFSVTLRAKGLSGRTVPLLLKEKGRVLLTKEISIRSDDEVKNAELTWVPSRPGRYHFLVEVPPQSEEAVKKNNETAFVLDVVRDKIRILLVSGRPSWNHRFLRDAAKGDPSIDLVSFIILRTATDAVNVSQNELSLIPFPTKKIFLEELQNFDLVIFENFSSRFYFPVQYLEKLRDFVRGGGGFWMLGGPLSFGGGAYAGTPLEEVLPVALDWMKPSEGYRKKTFTPRITPDGAKFPFFSRLAGTGQDVLPPFEGFNVSGPAREKSVVLADHTLPDGGVQPLIVLGRYGEGRTMAILSDSLWRWNFEMVGLGRGNIFYLSFVRQAIRWSVGDPQFQPLAVDIEDSLLKPGERLRASVRALGPNLSPAAEGDVTVYVHTPGGEKKTLPLTALAEGLFSVEFQTETAGTYELAVEAAGGEEAGGSASAIFQVRWPEEEYSDPGLNVKALDRLSGGRPERVFKSGDVSGAVDYLRRSLDREVPVFRVVYEEEKLLGNEWWAFLVFLGFLGTEWLIRKKEGLD